VARISSGLGDLALLEGSFSQASEYYRQALEIREQVLPPDHPLIAPSLQKPARSLARNGNVREAETQARRGLQLAMKKFGDRHPLSLECRIVLSEVLRLAGKPEAAWTEAEAVREILRDEKNPIKTASALRAPGLAKHALEHLNRAEKILAPQVQMFREKAPDSLDLADAETDLASVFRSRGRRDEAVRLLADALRIRKKIAGPGAPVTRKTAADFAAVGGSWYLGISAPRDKSRIIGSVIHD